MQQRGQQGFGNSPADRFGVSTGVGRVNAPCGFLGTYSSSETGSPRPSQHAAAEKGVIQRQSDDCAYCGDAGAVNAMEIEASQPAAPEEGEKARRRYRANDAEQYIDDGSRPWC